MTSESDAIIDVMNSISAVKFAISEPKKTRLHLKQQASWVIQSTSRKEPPEIGPLKAVWKDKEGAIWLEIVGIDDTMSLVERDYGEEGVRRFPYIEEGKAPTGDFPEEVAEFPLVVAMLKECEKCIAEISARTSVELKMIYDGGTGTTSFRVGAVIDAPTDMRVFRQDVLMIAQVLKEAHDAVVKVVWARWPDMLVDIP